MGFFDKLINSFKIESIEEAKPVHEFIWCNTTPNVMGQSSYIGAELNDSFLTFYLVDPKDTKVHTIKSYQLNTHIVEMISDKWVEYKMSPEKEKILVLSPQASCCQIFTDRFAISYNNKPKILEITMPYNYINHDEA